MTVPLLGMYQVHKRFGATQALAGVSLEVDRGEVLALIGENGAGKSTLMKVLSGAVAADEGSMQLDGRPYAPAGPHAARLAGVAMIYQELVLAPDLSVEDNIMLGQERHRLGLLSRRVQRAQVREVLDLLGHAELRPETPAGRLSLGAQQLVEIARALVADARVFVFDEPTSSLTQRDAARLFALIRHLKQSGRSVIYISHFLEELGQVADRYVVLRDGRHVASAAMAGADFREIISQMVGRSVEDLFPTIDHAPGEPLLDVRGLSGADVPQEVSFSVRRGEIFGIAGLVGAGRTELLRCLYGLEPVKSGAVRIGGTMRATGPAASIQLGLGLVSEDRKGEGLAQRQSISDNLTLTRLERYSRLGWLSLARRRQAVAGWIARLQLKARHPDQPVCELSGGNQQKVALARVLHQDADVLLLDEPTRGIDVATKAEIYRLMGQLAAEGKAIVFVSSYLPELLAVCDRIGVMARGRLRRVRPVAEWTEEEVIRVAIGAEEMN